jgi:glutaminyl-peptide cyclotransferase
MYFNISKSNVLVVLMVFLLACSENKKSPENIKNEALKPEVVLPKVPVFNEDSAYYFIEKQVAFGPRVPNSKGHEKAGFYLEQTLKKYADEIYIQRFSKKNYKGENMNLKNIIASFNPKAEKRILLAAHWDTRFTADQDTKDQDKPIDGANDGGSGVGVLLEIARMIKSDTQLLTIGVDILLLDGEDQGEDGGDTPDTWCLGAQYWAKNKHLPNYKAEYGILLDMVGAKGARFAMEGVSRYYARDIVNKVWNAGNMLGYGYHFWFYESPEITDDHLYINRAGIKMIDIIEYSGNHQKGYFGDYWHTHNDNMDVIDKNTLKAVGQTLSFILYTEK